MAIFNYLQSSSLNMDRSRISYKMFICSYYIHANLDMTILNVKYLIGRYLNSTTFYHKEKSRIHRARGRGQKKASYVI